jgi:hypothetical protein
MTAPCTFPDAAMLMARRTGCWPSGSASTCVHHSSSARQQELSRSVRQQISGTAFANPSPAAAARTYWSRNFPHHNTHATYIPTHLT